MGGIRISKNHGVNPSILTCFICGKDTGVLLLGRIEGDKQAPRKVTDPGERCDECKAHLKAGCALIEVRNGTDHANPYRTGRLCFVKREAIERIVYEADLVGRILSAGFAFMEENVYKKLIQEGDTDDHSE